MVICVTVERKSFYQQWSYISLILIIQLKHRWVGVPSFAGLEMISQIRHQSDTVSDMILKLNIYTLQTKSTQRLRVIGRDDNVLKSVPPN